MKNKIMKDLMFIFQCMFVLAMVWIIYFDNKKNSSWRSPWLSCVYRIHCCHCNMDAEGKEFCTDGGT